MRFLLDQGIGRGVVALLTRVGHEAVHIADVRSHEAADNELLVIAIKERRVIVAHDQDFLTWLALTDASAPSVIRFKMQGLKALKTAEIVKGIAATCRVELEAGAIVTVDWAGIRLRLLPLSGTRSGDKR